MENTNKDKKIRYDKDSQVKVTIVKRRLFNKLLGRNEIELEELTPSGFIELGSINKPKFEIYSIEIIDTSKKVNKWFKDL